ncbi:SDR family NAD(P)-dependent oxidoreductase [Vibrio mediterranei]|jgi:NAD(P)-dependent dehydrogenase (short-subunit alcohol dehydrogenase family)|uniref:SDR family NAD(P)-dependent oxidoreductase n=1 Tax=Vibrio mediterranei TaxID=689 RepID=UPI000D181947|nr:SDR family NAD(P)-dependent oxidoreductase [Vibrio mediterranei]MCG9664877.1 SDR family NAD(P)-dependent oxidoreductase [Vibrio mediterranei]PTC04512.1 oxidoreductase [Vibrio mediterranei]
MSKVILITGATDGIGLATAKDLIKLNHTVIIHGRTPAKVSDVVDQFLKLNSDAKVETIIADLSDLNQINKMADEVSQRFSQIDVLINNAGVFTAPATKTEDNLDIRFVVNTIAPYRLTQALIPLLAANGRVVNLSSAAQATVNLDALRGNKPLGDSDAYAQSKLALTMWSRALGLRYEQTGPMIVSVNPKSFLGSKMVKDAYGIAGNDLALGADILVRASLSDEFAHAHGKYFDNDLESFAAPHPDALNETKTEQVLSVIEMLSAR